MTGRGCDRSAFLTADYSHTGIWTHCVCICVTTNSDAVFLLNFKCSALIASLTLRQLQTAVTLKCFITFERVISSLRFKTHVKRSLSVSHTSGLDVQGHRRDGWFICVGTEQDHNVMMLRRVQIYVFTLSHSDRRKII